MKVRTLINRLMITILACTVLISGCGSGIDAGEGKKIGQIVKIGKHGMFCPTYEAEIIRGGFNGGSGVNGLALNFSIKNKKLADDLMTAMEQQEEIELHYSKRNFSGPCYSETDTIATGFKVLNNKEVKTESKVEIPPKKIEEIDMDDMLVTQ